MEKALLLQGKIPKLQQLFGKNWLQYGRACCQSRLVGGRVSKSVSKREYYLIQRISTVVIKHLITKYFLFHDSQSLLVSLNLKTYFSTFVW